jgi:ribonuclease III
VSGAFEVLANVLGHRFARPELLDEALTHPSAAAKRTYERLEFLGDRVLGLIVADMVYRAYPAEQEGHLAKRFAALVRRESLAQVAIALKLGTHLRVSRGEEGQGGRNSHTALADACEAVIGALYLDGGLPAAQAFVERWWRPLLQLQAEPPQDAKTALQEWAQGQGLPLPQYRVKGSKGPAHDPVFEIEVSLPGREPASAQGRSRRAAESAAATLLLARLRLEANG